MHSNKNSNKMPFFLEVTFEDFKTEGYNVDKK